MSTIAHPPACGAVESQREAAISQDVAEYNSFVEENGYGEYPTLAAWADAV